LSVGDEAVLTPTWRTVHTSAPSTVHGSGQLVALTVADAASGIGAVGDVRFRRGPAAVGPVDRAAG